MASALSSRRTVARQPTNFTGKAFYDRLQRYVLSESQLRENGYPRPSDDVTHEAKIYGQYKGFGNSGLTDGANLGENERQCNRCKKFYDVKQDGHPIRKEECCYHWGAPRFIDKNRKRHLCCEKSPGSPGCTLAPSHVSKHNLTKDMTGFTQTQPASTPSEERYGVYSLDCEMIYTTAGLECAEVTVIGEDYCVKYQTLVRPEHEIVDYNTRYSGITKELMDGTSKTLPDVRRDLLRMFTDKTILIGHSLESDLQCLKLIHSTVVDTSIVYIHKGLYKKGLRRLVEENLGRKIQDDAEGHSSEDDAVACMELVHLKVNKDGRW